MYFLFSGEGSTDMGKGQFDDRICEGVNYEYGPMTLIVDQLVKDRTNQSFIADQHCGFIPKSALIAKAKSARPRKKGVTLPGIKKKKETAYFYCAAHAFGVFANKEKQSRNDKVVAVLFRDADNHASSGRGEWSDKWDSILKGFAAAYFDAGVPMIPKPISEAWLLCALKCRPYQNCTPLEKRSSSPKADRPLKKELSDACGGKSSRSDLCTLVENGRINALQINMPSFNAFKKRLFEVL